MNFKDRFATDDTHHSMALTTDGCAKRLIDETPFRDNELAPESSTVGNNVEADERVLMNYVYILAQHGKQPSKNQTIEDFVIKNFGLLSRNI